MVYIHSQEKSSLWYSDVKCFVLSFSYFKNTNIKDKVLWYVHTDQPLTHVTWAAISTGVISHTSLWPYSDRASVKMTQTIFVLCQYIATKIHCKKDLYFAPIHIPRYTYTHEYIQKKKKMHTLQWDYNISFSIARSPQCINICKPRKCLQM